MPDPISGVASCFAVVSLVIQLINTVQEIHASLEDLKQIAGDAHSLPTALALPKPSWTKSSLLPRGSVEGMITLIRRLVFQPP